jgi:hypothetical protein
VSTALAMPAAALGGPLLRHFATQLDSARRLLQPVLDQGAAIRAREVDAVLTKLAAIQGEMERRAVLERDRAAILTHAAAGLGIPPHAVTLDALTTLLTPAEADAARAASAELRGLLEEIGERHALNRALMKQELAFLDHLTRMIGGGEDLGYRRPGMAPLQPRPSALRALDLEA